MIEDFGDLEFADNPDPRCPVVLVLDCSDSMVEKRPGEERSPMEALNGGLDTLFSALHKDPLAKRRAEVSFVSYGSQVAPATEFATVDNLVLPELKPMGVTSTGAAIVEALNALEARKAEYRKNGVQFFRPWIMLITDGLATDDITEASARLREAESRKSVAFFPIAVDGADLAAMERLAGKSAKELAGTRFEELFEWLSASQAAVSASTPGDAVPLPPTDDWAAV